MRTTEDQQRLAAQAAFAERSASRPVPIDNSRLPAGSDMYFYCKKCGWLCDTKSELYTDSVKPHCEACQEMIDKGWDFPAVGETNHDLH